MLRAGPVELLPYLDRMDVANLWNPRFSWNNVEGSPDNPNSSLSQIYLKVLVCPGDVSAVSQPGGLSYVAGAGYGDFGDHCGAGTFPPDVQFYEQESLNWNNDGKINQIGTPVGSPIDRDDSLLTRDSGLMWIGFCDANGASPTGYINDLFGIHDGMSQTLLLAENLNAGQSPDCLGTAGSWANPAYQSCAFIVPLPCAPGNNGQGISVSTRRL